MNEYESLSHTTWDCKYHIVFIPKCRRKTLYLELRRHLGEIFHKLAAQQESKIEEGHLMLDHVHMMISIPPKYAVSQVVGFIKGKSAIHLARVYGNVNAISSASIFGRPGFSSTRWDATKTPSELTFATRRKRTSGSTSSTFGDEIAAFRRLKNLGPRQRHHQPLERLQF